MVPNDQRTPLSSSIANDQPLSPPVEKTDMMSQRDGEGVIHSLVLVQQVSRTSSCVLQTETNAATPSSPKDAW